MMREFALLLQFAAALLVSLSSGGALAQAEGPVDAPDERADPTTEASERYRRGRELYAQKAWEQSLAEFDASRKIHPSWKSTSGAGLSLKQLGRFDEALEMFEVLLRDFGPELSPAVKSEAQRQVVELRGLVGTIDVTGAEPGATISADGRERGEFPLLAPLRVPSGSHVVRIFKEGFEPFETRLEVAGGRTETVIAHLKPLARSGRLRVVEERGRTLEVFIDGGIVGKTPWEGPLSPGEHVIALRGEGNLGAPPVPVSIAADRTTPLTISAEELEAELRVNPTPANASVLIDGVTVGRGVWEGRLRRGAHTVDVAASGFSASTQKVFLERNEREVLRVTLSKDPSSPLWRKPSRFFAEISAASLISPTLGGDVASCGAPCDAGLVTGGDVSLRAGYAFGFGLTLGVSAGYFGLGQTLTGRETAVTPVGRAARSALVTDELSTRGALVGGHAGFSFGETYLVRVGLGAGALLGAIVDERVGTFVATDGIRYELSPARLAPSVAYFWVSPEVRVGVELGAHVELWAGLGAMVLVSTSSPRWDAAREIDLSTDGIGTYGGETLGGSLVVSAGPRIGVRYSF